MRFFRIVLAIALCWGTSAYGANSFLETPGEFRIPVPDGWVVSGEATSLPVKLVNEGSPATLSVFRTDLTGADQIHSQEMFRNSVSGVIDSVVLQLPSAVLLTSTGYNDGRRADFVVEFRSADPGTGEPLEHYLVGILYRHPEGYQIMYSLWGRTTQSTYAAVKPAFQQMREGFSYIGPAEEDVFGGGGGSSNRWLLLLLAGMIAVLFWIRRRRAVSIKTTTGAVPIWRCTCGRANHIDNTVCRRCGAPRPERIS